MADTDKNKYLIESMEHTPDDTKVWWKPNHRGYTDDIREAGRYSYEEAKKIVDGANWGKTDPNTFNEQMWAEEQVMNGEAGYLALTVQKY
jgi:ABC-type transport system substrate-binding protein